MKTSPSALALRIALTYGLLAALWIFVADIILDLPVLGALQLPVVHQAIHLILAVFTSFAFYRLLRRQLAARQAAEAAEQSSEQRLVSVLRTAADAIILVDGEFRIQLFNRGAERIFGYAAAEVLGQPVDLLLPTGVVERHRQHMQRLAASQVPMSSMADRLEVSGRRKDGTAFAAEASVSKALSGDRLSFTVILHDITRRKQAESQREAALVALSQAHKRLNRAADELETRVRERTAELERANQELAMREAALSAEGRERERLLAEVDAQRRLLHTVVANAPASIAVFDGESLCVKWANAVNLPPWSEATRSGALAGRHLTEIVPGAEERGLLELFRRVAQSGEGYARAEDCYEDPAWGRSYWRWSLLALITAGGGVPDLLLMAIDVTQQVLARARVEQLAAAADRQAAELASVFTAMADAVVVYNGAGRVQRANPAAIALLGFDPAALQPADLAARLTMRGMDGHTLATEQLPPIRALQGERVSGERLILSTTDGRAPTVLASASPLYLDGQVVGAVNVLHDITERECMLDQLREYSARLEEVNQHLQAQTLTLQDQAEQLRLQARELSTVLQIAQSTASTLELNSLLALILDQLRSMIDCTGAAIFVPRGDAITILAYRGPLPQADVLGFRVSLAEAPGWQAVERERRAVVIADLQDDSPFAQNYRRLAARQIKQTMGESRSWMGVPLIVKEEMIGMLRLDRKEPGYFTSQHARLAQAVAGQAAIAIENARLYADAQRVAALEERQRLARDLHDSVSQTLYGIVLGTHAARKMLHQSPDQVEATLGYVLTQAETAVSEMRALIFELRPESLAREGLVAAINRQVNALRARRAIELNCELCGEPDIALEAKEDLYRVAQEALNNTVRHAKARRVDVRLCYESGYAVLEVVDDGIGFDPQSRSAGHFGLQSMGERAARHGGALEIESQPGRGTRVHLRLPLLGERID